MNAFDEIFQALPVAASGATRHARHCQFLSFMLSKKTFAIDVLSVNEIIERDCLGTLPHLPKYLAGVILLRNATVPVIDLSACLHHRKANVKYGTCIVVTVAREGAQHVLGMMVDKVKDVLNIKEHDIEPTHTDEEAIHSGFVHGTARVKGKQVTLLNADMALSPEEMSVLAGLGAGCVV
jgi:purine-binding chemotaxis protein CheW